MVSRWLCLFLHRRWLAHVYGRSGKGLGGLFSSANRRGGFLSTTCSREASTIVAFTNELFAHCIGHITRIRFYSFDWVEESVAPNNAQKPCSVLTTPCQQPSKLLKYATFLGCELNSDIEQLTDEEDAQHPSQIPIVFSAIATVGGLTGKVPGWAGITGAVTGGIYTIGIAAKSNQECTESVYGH
jgi:hypothetical protein